jgi:hypothetical protein
MPARATGIACTDRSPTGKEDSYDDILPKVPICTLEPFAPARVGLVFFHAAVFAALPLSKLPAPVLSSPLCVTGVRPLENGLESINGEN